MKNNSEQSSTRCVLMRGGTSKALFFHEEDIPAVGDERDRFLKRAMGTPDHLQIDGLGGSRLVTSKVAIIRKSARDDADVDYTFAQVDVERDLIGYDGNCGNISSAVGPFAIDEGLLAAVEPVTTVRIFNTNTDKVLVAKVPVLNGSARVGGNCKIAGVPRTGAEILMDYSGTVGAKFGRLLPTTRAMDTLCLQDGRTVEITLCDVANPCVFISAADIGMTCNEMPVDISSNEPLIDIIAEIQAKAGQLLQMWPNWRAVSKPGLPLAVIVAPAEDFMDANSQRHELNSMDLRARLVFLGKCHDSMAGTGSLCTAAASRVPGSIVERMVPTSPIDSHTLRIGHPIGVMEVKVVAKKGADPLQPHIEELGLSRTARRLMAGELYVPCDPQT